MNAARRVGSRDSRRSLDRLAIDARDVDDRARGVHQHHGGVEGRARQRGLARRQGGRDPRSQRNAASAWGKGSRRTAGGATVATSCPRGATEPRSARSRGCGGAGARNSLETGSPRREPLQLIATTAFGLEAVVSRRCSKACGSFRMLRSGPSRTATDILATTTRWRTGSSIS